MCLMASIDMGTGSTGSHGLPVDATCDASSVDDSGTRSVTSQRQPWSRISQAHEANSLGLEAVLRR